MLESDLLRVTVIPEVGAKIHELVYKPVGRDLLFHHPRVELRAPVFGVDVDNWWTGGIDDCLPTGHPCTVGGEKLPFLGEAWSLPWRASVTEDGELHLVRDGVITPFRIERRMRLGRDSAVLTLGYKIENTGFCPFSFIWGIHPGLPVGPATTIQVPAARGVIAESLPGDRLGEPGSEYEWPLEGITSPGREPNGTADLHFATDLRDGWLAVCDEEWGTGFGMTFSKDVFRCVWIWLVDGGWRSIRCVAVEPWIGYPARLDAAIEKGMARSLEPGETLETSVRIVAFEPIGALAGFDADGMPIPKGRA